MTMTVTSSASFRWKPKAASSASTAVINLSGIVVTRDHFLVRSPLAMRATLPKDPKQQPEIPTNHLRAAFVEPEPAYADSKPEPEFSCLEPPPGLGPPLEKKPQGSVAVESQESPVDAEAAPAEAVASPSEPVDKGPYEVLLRNLPEKIANTTMMRVMLEQAKLDAGVVGIDSRPGGKALIKLSSLAWARLCMNHFHGREWGGSSGPVTALYVRTVKRTPSKSEDAQPAATPAPKILKDVEPATPAPKSLSAEAPVFVPTALSRLSAEASEFVPVPVKMKAAKAIGGTAESREHDRFSRSGRFCSDASTEAGRVSHISADASDSDSECCKEVPSVALRA